ncbi:solute carrier family 12 member 9 [Platysternon megacephalum]|uniref:Solute carrier family 12 member 9 n=1 Tax=Platysternon megacephalum TaxID=55544 RepID=A0A4D9E5W0_9SAUR|nr:solute carrier family 12 member 9 [Platysternon megacephalum]
MHSCTLPWAVQGLCTWERFPHGEREARLPRAVAQQSLLAAPGAVTGWGEGRLRPSPMGLELSPNPLQEGQAKRPAVTPALPLGAARPGPVPGSQALATCPAQPRASLSGGHWGLVKLGLPQTL